MKTFIMRIKLCHFAYMVVLFFLSSCFKPNNYSNVVSEVIKNWDTRLFAASENHPTPGIADTARLQFKVFSDNSVRFDVFIDSLNVAGDRITGVMLHLGGPLTDSGTLLLNLNPRISGWYASGVLPGLRQSFIDTLVNDSIPKYINVLTANAPKGLVRGQLGPQIVYAKKIALNGSSVTPPVSTTAKGTAYIRITDDRKFYSKIVIDTPDVADPVTTAVLHQGTVGTNGPAIFTLASSSADFGVAKTTNLTESGYNDILNGRTYVLVNSTLHPTGLLRGQLR